MHFEILDQDRSSLLPLLGNFKNSFYLAGGTALALHIGHRKSIDFDFFTHEHIDTEKLFEKCKELFQGHTLVITQNEPDTLGIIVDGVSITWMTYPYALIDPLLPTNHLMLASIPDICGMKCSAITGRSLQKDYVDMYYILKHYSLEQVCSWCQKKLPMIDIQLILKSLVYFDDVVSEQIDFMTGYEVAWADVQKFLEQKVRDFQAQI